MRTLLACCFFAGLGGLLPAQVTPVTCISEITGGATVDFEMPGTMVNEILPAYGLIAEPDKLVTTMVGWVVGNPCAPFHNRGGFGDGFRIRTTAGPWEAVGLSALGTGLYDDRTFVMTAYDEFDVELGSVTRVFDAGFDFDSYNEGVIFIGLASTTPIHSFTLSADNPNVAWDYLTYGTTDPVDALFVRGDANADGLYDIADGAFVLTTLFVPGTPPPLCADATDANDDGLRDVADAVYILNSLFLAGSPPPPAPHPECGADPTTDGIDCVSYPFCP